MDPRRFDELARDLGRKRSRRQALRLLLAAVLGTNAVPKSQSQTVAAQSSCSFGQSQCGTGYTARCVNLDTDSNNCGACGNQCDFGMTCRNAACQCSSDWLSTETACASSFGMGVTCVDLQTDPDHCGACGNVCDFGLACRNGQCDCDALPSSLAARTPCPVNPLRPTTGMTCADLQTDADHCGACGNACGFGLICRNGQCDCDALPRSLATRTPCPVNPLRPTTGMTCADLQIDADHCGACGNACEFGCTCQGGTCDCDGEVITAIPGPALNPSISEFMSAKCDYIVNWQQPWTLAADFSTLEYDGVTLATSTSAGEPISMQIWGIPVNGSTGMNRVVGAANTANAVTNAFVLRFRDGMPNLKTVQEASGRTPMIIDYAMLDETLIREFIHGSLIHSDKCAYVSVTGVQNLDNLPVDFDEQQARLIEGFFEVEDS